MSLCRVRGGFEFKLRAVNSVTTTRSWMCWSFFWSIQRYSRRKYLARAGISPPGKHSHRPSTEVRRWELSTRTQGEQPLQLNIGHSRTHAPMHDLKRVLHSLLCSLLFTVPPLHWLSHTTYVRGFMRSQTMNSVVKNDRRSVCHHHFLWLFKNL
jgi:hypothetical protein